MTRSFWSSSLLVPSLAFMLVAQLPPPGFVDEEIANPGLGKLTGLDFLPDGRLIVSERSTGALKVLAGGAIGLVGVVSGVHPGPPSEKGLLSCAVDPGWPARPYVYVLYTHQPSSQVRISMFTVGGDLTDASSTNLVLGGEFLLIDDIPDGSTLHNGGKLRFGPDGFLYASLGDDLQPCMAQVIDNLLGKVLRLDVSQVPASGSGPPPRSSLAAAGNPFAGQDGQLVWCYGLRNPYSFDIDPATGELFIADVGGGMREEINHCPQGGLNFGWPALEGSLVCPGCGSCGPLGGPFVAPLVEYSHGLAPKAVISVALYRNQPGSASAFGADFDGDYFYFDFFDGTIFRLDWNGATFSAPVAWAIGINQLTDALVGPDGAIYYARGPYFDGSLHRIRRVSAASVTSLGSGCSGSSPTPLALAASGLPTLGNAGFALDVSGGPASATALLFFSVGMSPSPTVLTSSCSVYLDLFSTLLLVQSGILPAVGILDAAGATQFPLPVPALQTLAGARIDGQAIVIDPPAPGGLVTSNALTLVLWH